MVKFYTTSLRDPYDIPDDKVSLDGIETTNEDRDLAAKYADYALGKFLEQAASEGYYQDTIFLVIANHVSSVKPGMEFPVDDFTIPAVIIAPNVMPHVDHRQVSQIDMGMTLLALNGINGSVPNVGQDLTNYNIKERAIMQLNNTFALLIGDRMIELSPNTKPVFYNVEYQDGRVIATKDTSKRSTAQKEDDDELLYHAERINNIGPFMFRTESMSKRCLRLKVPQAQK
ncbi:MAG: sulfatase-like hydrolase/transferase [Anaerobiospirillum succiniciproducens]|uniref:sulfatase-like hydrolase/transferase n=1 Tax=Anaerobiospirillum succiniciproducens TaxID=13335 RepID=UPI002A764283|nr:sulfatase-like hydrolase/transferase [Anaerobiospirillum succiniciproducens]MDY2797779.1 sulfatase-like hydrolase/transferase [Anaerobiospirillum succiniciproducens]